MINILIYRSYIPKTPLEEHALSAGLVKCVDVLRRSLFGFGGAGGGGVGTGSGSCACPSPSRDLNTKTSNTKANASATVTTTTSPSTNFKARQPIQRDYHNGTMIISSGLHWTARFFLPDGTYALGVHFVPWGMTDATYRVRNVSVCLGVSMTTTERKDKGSNKIKNTDKSTCTCTFNQTKNKSKNKKKKKTKWLQRTPSDVVQYCAELWKMKINASH